MTSDAAYYRLAMRIFADFSATIAVPAVLGALAGKWLDTQYGTEPRYLIICLAAVFALTALVIAKKAKIYSRQYKRLIEKEIQTDPKV
ncbi:AtpZ/AtpI family protein [Patescibacteria group bacterium]|nr:AtpZ/AtpI family protein [Patescibacteria group bacterium]MBU1705162.1 AtpZ/AtpI family protein [Patescibacteria group bacterium]